MDIGEDAAGIDRDRIVQGIDIADFGHPVEREQNLFAAGIRHTGTSETRITTLRDDGRLRVGADGHDLRHFLR